jgi:hypothetical protein
MRFALIRALGFLLALAAAPDIARAQPAAMVLAQASEADYRRRLQAYEDARAAFEAEAKDYWDAIAEKRRARNAKRRDGVALALDDYVLTQPPVYAGPKRPVDPSPQDDDDDGPKRARKPIPVVADFVKAAAEHFQIAPQRPASDAEFKRAYARAAIAEGLTRDQAVRVYAFETGGDGTHDLQSGLSSSRPGARAISTAIGYNQLLTANSVELMAEQGHHIFKALTARAALLSGPQRAAMERKLHAVKRMVAFARSVPDEWSHHVKLGATPQGWGVHAMTLDIDVGPLLQVHKLLTSVHFARRKGWRNPLSAAELEMMNLTGDGTGFDMVAMPQALRERVPTANFFQRSGYERNPVAIRHNTVARLLAVTDARMDSASAKQGARDLAAAFQSGLRAAGR